MKFSVLMSVYKNDNPEFLNQALKSIYDNQTVKPDEIVIVIDGPIDKALEETITDFRKGKENIVKIYPQSQNKGLGVALNVGINECTGDYVFRMDSDDISLPNRFEKQIQYVKNHPEIDVLGAGISEFKFSTNEKMRNRICPQNQDEIIKMGKHRNPVNHVTVCAKRQSIIDAGNYQPLPYSEDYYLWIKMISKGYKFANLLEPLVYVRIGNGFTSRRGKKENINSWRTIQEYMVNNNMVSNQEAKNNMLMVKLFTYTPSFLKDVAYKLFLRK